MKKFLTSYSALKKFLKDNKCYEIINNELFCNVCNEKKTYNPNEGVVPLKKHMNTASHIKLSKNNGFQSRLPLESYVNSSNSDFDNELLIAFAKANIPIQKLQNVDLKAFLEKYTSRRIKSESFYRKFILEPIYENSKMKLKSKYLNKEIYFIFDETTDSLGRYILSIMVGECSEIRRTNPDLIKLCELERSNSEIVLLNVLEVLNYLFDSDVKKYKFLRLLVTDGASYCKKTANMLKKLIPSMKHIICVCHGLHNLCETIRNQSDNLNFVISFLKRYLVKNREFQRVFNDVVNVPLPKFPVITRWGTWLEFAIFLYRNLDGCLKFLEALPKELFGVDKIISAIKSKLFEKEIRVVYEHSFLVEAIKSLESSHLSTEQQISIMLEVRNKVYELSLFKKRIDQIFAKNPDFNYFENFNELKCPKSDKIFSYVPLNTVFVESSFSSYRYLLSDRRYNLTVENLERLLFLYLNKT
jgi:hypothetical protein